MFKHIIFIFIFINSWGVLSNTYAQQIFPLSQNIKSKGISSLEYFKTMAILDQGRIKPLDTYARGFMVQFSGKNSFNQKPAIEWLAKILFSPGNTRKDKVFLINNAEVLSKLEIATEAKGRYSFAQIEPSLQKLIDLAKSAEGIKENNRNIFESDVIRLYQNIVLYTNLANSFSFAIPNIDFQVNNDDIVQLLNLSQGKNLYSFLDIASKAEAIMSATKNVDQKTIEERTLQEKELLRLLGNLLRWSMSYESSSVAMIPTLNPQDKFWSSPWEAINREFKNPEIEKEINFLRNLVVYYWNGEQLQFDMDVRAFQRSIKSRLVLSGEKNFNAWHFKIEIFNNYLNPLLWTKLFYGIALFMSILYILFKRTFFTYFSLFLLILGFILHAWAMISFTIIMSRPPVENYHEIFSSIGLVSILFGFVLIFWNKKSYGVAISSACGLGFLIVAGQFFGIF